MDKTDIISIWDLPQTEIFVLLEDDYRKKFIHFCLDILKRLNKPGRSAFFLATYLNKQAKNYGIECRKTRREIHHWIKGVQYLSLKRRYIYKKNTIPVSIPLWILKELSHLSSDYSKKFSLGEIEKHVKFYRHKSGIVINPYYNREYKLPIKVTPTFTAIMIHLIADGCAESQPYYSQDHKIGLNNFIEKIYNTFGKCSSKYGKNYFTIPSFIKNIFKQYYHLHSFRSDIARIPPLLYQMSDNHRIAAMTAFILDEGAVSDSIKIFSSNKKLLSDVKNILFSLNIKSYPVMKGVTSFMLRIVISPENVKLLKIKIDSLRKTDPLCNLSYKQHKLDSLYKLVHLPGYPHAIHYNYPKILSPVLQILERKRSNIKSLIEKKELPTQYGYSTSEIQSALYLKYNIIISHQALRRFLNSLRRKNCIKDISYSKHFKIWSLINNESIKCPDTSILSIIKSQPRTIRQISQLLHLPYDVVEYRIRKRLLKKNSVRRADYLFSKDRLGRIVKTVQWKS